MVDNGLLYLKSIEAVSLTSEYPSMVAEYFVAKGRLPNPTAG